MPQDTFLCGMETTIYPRRWLLLVVLLMGAFLSPLDFFIVNVTLPAIRDSLHASDSALQLVVTGYGATYAVLVVTGGRLGDIYGRKTMFMTGMGGFTLASLLCAAAPSAGMLIAARILQGMSAALLAPQVLSSIRVIFPPEEQGRAMGFYGAVFGLASIAGQLCGGLLLELRPFGLTWQTVFLINVPVGITAMLLAWPLMPENRPARRPRLDIPGMLLVSLTLLLFIYPLIKGREAGWPWWVFVSIGASCVLLYLLLRVERRTAEPLLDLGLFRHRAFVQGLGIIFLFNHTAAFFMVYPVYLQSGLHWNVLHAGLAVLPYAAGFFIGPAVSWQLGERSLITGLCLLAAGFLGAWLLHTPGIGLYIVLLCAGIGHGIVMPVIVRTVLKDVPPEKAGAAAGVVSTAVQLGSALGVAVIGTIFFAVLSFTEVYATAFMTAMGILFTIAMAGLYLAFQLKKNK